MRKKISIILFIVAIVILGIIIYRYSDYQELTEVKNEETTQTQEEIAEIINKAIESQDTSLCEKIEVGDFKEKCITNAVIAKARINNDPTICDQFKKEDDRTICKNAVIVYKAILNGNPSFCEELSDEKAIEDCKEELR